MHILHNILASETAGSINNLEVVAETAWKLIQEGEEVNGEEVKEKEAMEVAEGVGVEGGGAIIPDHIETFSQQ